MITRITRLFSAVETLAGRIGYIRLMFLLSLCLLFLVALWNPLLLASYVWAASKVLLAGVIGFALDKAAFPGADPRTLDGIERSMAQSRKGVLIAAAMIAAGLIG